MLLPPLPGSGITNWQVFTAQQDATTTRGWEAWLRPPGASWFFILAVSPGGGGGGGQSTAAAARSGGGGGGSGAINRIIIPAIVMPDLLYVRVGNGGSAAPGGAVVACGDPALHEQVLTLLAG